ncbi:MAG: hypothetical protein RBT76_04255 [candidate division Zixibacteria bacterium]|jgi:hypothetical protein|nr:hypothetical protein [candidate division Zixibacteria bacterium]
MLEKPVQWRLAFLLCGLISCLSSASLTAAAEDTTMSRLEYLATYGFNADSTQKYPLYIPGDSTTYLGPRQTLFSRQHIINQWVDCSPSQMPTLVYYFYADYGYIDVKVEPMDYSVNWDFYVRTNGLYPESGSIVLRGDAHSYGEAEEGYFHNDSKDKFVLIMGPSAIDQCEGFGWVQGVTITLTYTPYEWDLQLTNVTTSTVYPQNSATITVNWRNNNPDSLYARSKFEYGFDVDLKWTPHTCYSSVDRSNRVWDDIAPYETVSETFTINGPQSGAMNVFAVIDDSQELPHSPSGGPWNNCSSPLQLLWSVHLEGQLSLLDPLTATYQNLAGFQFEFVRPGWTTTVLAQVTTDANGHYTAEIASGNFDIYARISSEQPPPYLPVKNYGTSGYFRRSFNTNTTATAAQHTITLLIDSSTFVSPDALYPALRITRDLFTTDSLLSQVEPFSLAGWDFRSLVDVYMDTSGTATLSGWGLAGLNPVIVMPASEYVNQIACHELGHQAMYMLQNNVVRPPAPSSSPHWRNSVTDTVFAFDEGFSEFVHGISTKDELLRSTTGLTGPHHLETNQYWQGTDSNVATTYEADSVEGCVASILYDLYDNRTTPASRTIAEDDLVRSPQYMLEVIMKSIFNYRTGGQQTRALRTFLDRMLHDPANPWFTDSLVFDPMRTEICNIFRDNHLTTDSDFCQASSIVYDIDTSATYNSRADRTTEFSSQPSEPTETMKNDGDL